MKKEYKVVLFFLLLILVFSCNNKKLTEVVEVPLPVVQESVALSSPDDVKANGGPFEMIKLPYSYSALAPEIDTRTMETHYSKHYLTYTNNLNKAIAGTELEELPIEEILSKSNVDSTDLRNNAGGYYNHTLFWQCLAPKSEGQPKDTLMSAIVKDFGSFDNFETLFKNKAAKQFGSGWIWLVVDKTGKLQVTSTQNQDNPLMPNAIISGTPILALDVWEHAYYLNYQYKRKNYIDAFFTLINWSFVQKKYEETFN